MDRDQSHRTPPLTRRQLLAATGATGAAAVLGSAGPVAAGPGSPGTGPSLTFTRATNGAATLATGGDTLIAEVQSGLWSLPRGGGRAVPLTPAGLEPNRPTHSPDGDLVAFCAYQGGGFHLWTMRPDGSELKRRTDGPWDDRAPAWSPDGTRLAFCSERGGDPDRPGGGCPYRVHVLDLATGEITRVTGLPGQDGPLQDGGWEDFDPTWSPDGSRLLFVRGKVVTTGSTPSVEARTVAAVAADGTGPVTVAHTETEAAQVMTPALAPDGRLAYLRTTPAPHGTCTLVVAGEPVPVDGDLAPVPPRWTARGELLLTLDGRFTLVRPEAPARTETIPFRAVLPVDRPRRRTKEYDLGEARVRPARGIHLPALSPDGRSVAFAALNALWLARTAGGR
ncbi:TolB-like translocation protein, partial [Streptomyces scabiei]